MNCPSCGATNPEDKAFCGDCGTRLILRCPSCNGENPPDKRFCGDCGSALADAGSGREQASTATSPFEAERRQLTVMFCDLVGSTALSERLDPEDLRGLLNIYHEACAAVVDRYEGHIAKYLGDGLLVYFGYPQAHEDDAERAVRAALDIVAEMNRLSDGIAVEQDITLQVHLGIHTGLVIAGEMGAGDAREIGAIVGETPNIAARLEQIAEPNAVLISEDTKHLIEGLFILDALGPQRLKGVSTPVSVYRVRETSEARGRLDAMADRALTPLIGRAEEISLLVKRWAQAKEGESQVVLLSGDPGVGKSRIVRGFRDALEGEPHSRILYFCSPYHRNSALYPLIEQFQRACRFSKNDSPEAKLSKLERVLSDLDLPVARYGPLFGSLFSLPIHERYPPLGLASDQQKAETFASVARIVKAMANRDPVLMVVEDAHWVDPSTQDLLGILIEELRSIRFFLLVTFRSEFEPPWQGQAQITALHLNRLSRKECAAIVERVPGGKALPRVVLDQIVEKSEGVPLFVEELTKTLLETGFLERVEPNADFSRALPSSVLPASLRDSLTARLDRLGPVKEVAQLAAVLGRTFNGDLLSAVASLDRKALARALSKLIDAGLVFKRGSNASASYEFKHALVRDAAYESLLKSKRQDYHGRIARKLEADFPEVAASQPEILAHHFTEAGLSDEAVDYWEKAGQWAAERSANVEAIAHLRAGLEVVRTLSPGVERDSRELDLHVLLGPVLMAVKGFAAPEVSEVYNRSEKLLRNVGDTPHAFPVTWGLWYVKQHSGQIDAACQLADKLLPLAERQSDRSLLLQAHHAAWTSRFTREELHSVREHTERGIALYSMDEHRSHSLLYGGHDPGMCCRIIGGLTTLLLGYPDQARNLTMDGVKLAEDLGHAFSLALALSFSGTVYLYLRDSETVRNRMEALSNLCAKHGMAHFGPMATMLRGWADVDQEGHVEGIGMMREGLAAFRATGAKRLSFQLAVLADALRRTGRIDESLETLDEALQVIENTKECRWEPEVCRLKGVILSSAPVARALEAEAFLRRAIEASRRQDAKWFELRATVDLAKFWSKQGRQGEACDVLRPVYSWFSEGFDTPDLTDARALIAGKA